MDRQRQRPQRCWERSQRASRRPGPPAPHHLRRRGAAGLEPLAASGSVLGQPKHCLECAVSLERLRCLPRAALKQVFKPSHPSHHRDAATPGGKRTAEGRWSQPQERPGGGGLFSTPRSLAPLGPDPSTTEGRGKTSVTPPAPPPCRVKPTTRCARW